jgi:hypothetical protein
MLDSFAENFIKREVLPLVPGPRLETERAIFCTRAQGCDAHLPDSHH